jgi:hypothetical protein
MKITIPVVLSVTVDFNFSGGGDVAATSADLVIAAQNGVEDALHDNDVVNLILENIVDRSGWSIRSLAVKSGAKIEIG